MNTNKKLNSAFGLMLSVVFTLLTSCNNSPDHPEGVTYTCPMHPEVISDVPGECPICHMNLELKVSEATHQLVSPNKQVLSRQSTVKLSEQNEDQNVIAYGYIDVDRNRNKTVSARFGGRIEKLYVKYNLQKVKKGQRIMEIYSPELNTVQEEHLFLFKSGTNKTLLDQSRKRLKLLGISEDQISQLENKGTFTQTITVYSPANGYIIFNNESAGMKTGNTDKKSSMDMNTSSSAERSFAPNRTDHIREGAYINKGESIFSINDLQKVWAIISIPSEMHTQIKKNAEIEISSELFREKKLSGKVNSIEQTFEESQQRFTRIRVEISNAQGELKLNSLVTAEIPSGLDVGFQIPVSAVYRTGLKSFVWVKIGSTENGTGIFKLRTVAMASANNGLATIISGLSGDEEIAEHAGLLADSETFLNEN